MTSQEKKPILFGLAGDPLTDCVTDTEQEAESKEEALEKAVKCKQTKYLKALEQEDSFVILWDVEKAQQALFEVETAEEAEECVRAGAQVNARTIYGWMPLHKASVTGRERVVEWLLAAGAKVNARSLYGWTPLHDASMCGWARVAEVLLARGADMNARDAAGRTPLSRAVERGHSEVAELLRARPNNGQI